MADKLPLLRDVRSGRMLSQLESDMKRAQLDAATFGQTGFDKEMTGFSLSHEDDSPNVHRYTKELIGVVQNYDGPAVKLLAVLPLLDEVKNLATADATLSKAEQKRVAEAHSWLTNFVRRKASVLTRVQTTLRNLSREKLPQYRDKASQALSGSKSGLARMVGSLIAPGSQRGEDGSHGLLQSILDARASILKNAHENKTMMKQRVQANLRMSEDDEDFSDVDIPELAEPKPKKSKKSKVKKVAKRGPRDEEPTDIDVSPTGSMVFDDMLDVQREILRKIEVTNQLLRTGREDMIHLEDEKERKGTKKDTKVEKLPEGGDKSKENGDSILGKVFGGGLMAAVRNAFGSILKWFGPGSLLATMIMPALEGLGIAAGVIGSAFVGWKVGSWISKMIGLGDSSEALAKLMDGSQSALETAKAAWYAVSGQGRQQRAGAKEDTIQAARRHAREMGRPMEAPNTYEDAVRMNNEWNEWNKKRVKATQTPQPQAQPKVPVIDADSWVMPTQPMPTSTSRLMETPDALNVPDKKQVGMKVESLKTMPDLAPESTKPEPTKVKKDKKQDAKNMTVSEDGLKAIAKYEGFREKPYWDVNGYAIGYGSHEFNGKSVDAIYAENPNFTITREQADANLRERLEKDYLPFVRRALKRPVTQGEFDALASVAWNRGAGGLTKDKKFIEKVNNDSVTKEDFLKSFTFKGDPKVVEGLQKRRGMEFAMYDKDSVPEHRQASTMESLTNAAKPSSKPSVTVVAPPAVKNDGKGQDVRTNTIVPIRIDTRNPDETLRALRNVNMI